MVAGCSVMTGGGITGFGNCRQNHDELSPLIGTHAGDLRIGQKKERLDDGLQYLITVIP
jgi:hypothetical protein